MIAFAISTRALVADLDFDVGSPGQLLLAADLGDGRAHQAACRLEFDGVTEISGVPAYNPK